MTYEKPSVVELGAATSLIQSNKPNFGEPTLSDPRSTDDAEITD